MGFTSHQILPCLHKLNGNSLNLQSLVEAILEKEKKQEKAPTPISAPKPTSAPKPVSALNTSIKPPSSQKLTTSDTKSQQVSNNNQSANNNNHSENSCVICFEVEINSVIIPCGHLALCFDCASKVSKSSSPLCPICRKQITQIVQTFHV